MSSIIFKHEILFQQKRDGTEHCSLIVLQEGFRMFAPNGAEGTWRRGSVLNNVGVDVHLYRHAPPAESTLLFWRWNSETFDIEIGKWQTHASHKAGEEKSFRKWICLFGAKRSVDWKFSVASPYSDGTGLAEYKLHGSSDTYDPMKQAYWEILRYNR
jgi:hypothetical protein